jgi:exopolysaccharide biosynthesis protein
MSVPRRPRAGLISLPLRRARVAALVASLILLAPVSGALATTGSPATSGSPVRGANLVAQDITSGFAAEGRAPVAPGVMHAWGSIETDRSGHQAVHLLEVDLNQPVISLEASLSNDAVAGLETVSSQAHRHSAEGHRVVAAVNGDVWSGWDTDAQEGPKGFQVQDGELVTFGPYLRPTLGINANGRPFVGSPVETAFLTLGDGTIRMIERLNQARSENEFALFTPRFGNRTATELSGTDVVLEGVPLPITPTAVYQAVVRDVRPAAGGLPIDAGTLVLNGPAGSLLDVLRPGEAIQLTLSITPEWQGVQQAVGAREYIVRDGAVSISPTPAMASQLHPRTAIGITAAGDLVIATVDGRQAGYSTGVDLQELAELMLARGAVQALNMDGGGSTTMAVRLPGDPEVSVVNRPSDGRERAVTNGLLVVSSAPTGPLASVVVVPSQAALWQGEVATFAAKGQDAAYNAVELSPSEIAWSTVGVGKISAGGRYSATSPGTATIAAAARGIGATAAVTVTADVLAPVAKAPTHEVLDGRSLSTGAVPFLVSWPAATDKGRGVASYEVEQRTADGAWTPLARTPVTDRNVRVELVPGRQYRFRVRATDRAGNVGAWVGGTLFRLGAVQELSSAVVRGGHWTLRTSASFYGGRAISSETAGSSARIAFAGQEIAWISTVGPTRGAARVYVDGALVRTVDLWAKTAATQRIAFATSWSSAGRHTLEIRVVGTPGRPRVDVDAFVSTGPGS